MKCAYRLASTIVTILSLSQILSAADWKDALKEKFSGVYKYSKNAFGDPTIITQPGTILIINKDGISGDVSSAAYSETKVRDGKVRQGGGVVAFLQDKKTTRTFSPGERFYITNLDVDDDKINIKIISVDKTAVSVSGSTQQARYRALIQFEYDKKTLPTLDFAKIIGDISAVLIAEDVAKSVSTKTISLNQTRQEVEAILGKPETVVELGSKIILTYKSMKVVFTDGKVSDVQ